MISSSVFRGLRIAGMAIATLALAGCSMGSFLGGSTDQRFAGINSSAEQIAQGAPALPAIATECPAIRVRDGAGSYRVYTGNRTTDPSALRYQGVIERSTRNCVVSNGRITVQMGAAGRIITGPALNAGQVSVPLRFVVERDGVSVFSQLYNVPASITAGGLNEFAHTVENVQIPYTGGETITIWVGFDG